MRIPLALLISIQTLTACADEPTTSSTPSGHPAFANGAVVSRFTFPQLFGVVDFERNLTLLGGIPFEDVAALCADPDIPASDLSTVQDVAKPTGDNKALIKDEEQLVVIWAGVPPEGQRISCTFQNQSPLAVGTVRSVYNDNDIFGGPGPGATSFHYRATGTVTNPVTGQEYRVLIKFGGRVTPDGSAFIPEAEVIQLTPVGGDA